MYPTFAFQTIVVAAIVFFQSSNSAATTYYLDADGGSDLNGGTSPSLAWASLDRASIGSYQPGDQILLQAGDTFNGKLYLEGVSGAQGNPVVVAAFGTGSKPVIDASGYLAGVHIRNSQHLEVRDLEITADGGATVDGSTATLRYGVLADVTWNSSLDSIAIRNLHIHDIFPELGDASEGATPTTYKGTAIRIAGTGNATVTFPASNIVVEGCLIERTGYKAVELQRTHVVDVLNNNMKDIGGPAIQPGRCQDVVVRGNVVDKSGSFIDSRMHGRGSGIWPWTCQRVLIEKNTFKHARGRADSCGIHIDFNCRDVVVQYNLSIDNAGGFIEILGNNHNCTYRYNISINDGARVKGELDQGTIANNQDGHVIWISGYVGSGNPYNGPFNSYLYNNTVYVTNDITTTFSIQETTDGLLIANNIFYIEGPTVDITGDFADDYTQAMADRVVWTNNLYQRTGIVPTFNLDLFTETGPVYGDPLFPDKGGLSSEDYIPTAANVVEDRGIIVANIPGDPIGLTVGLPVAEDYFGNPILALPDMGAIEISGLVLPLPDATFASAPAYLDADSATMTSVAAPYNTEYYFTETSDNLGGDDSGWQLSPTYVDDGLLPNTVYSYSVRLRDALDVPGLPSTEASLLMPPSQPFQNPVILFEDFSSQLDPVNDSSPFTPETWYVSYEPEAQENSVISNGGRLRVGWGYDRTMVLWQSIRTWDTGRSYQFSGDWEIDNTLDVHQGLVVGLAEFDSSNGDLVQRIKEVTIGDLVSPAIGQTGSFTIDLTPLELASAGVGNSTRVGVFFEHEGAGSPDRNDVYLVDNLELHVLGGEADTDGDGIPDSAEPGLGLDPGNGTDGDGDLDGDGDSNFAEYLTGSDLDNPDDRFEVRINLQSGLPTVVVPGSRVRSGRLYILEQADASGNWTATQAFSGDAVGPGTDQFLPLLGTNAMELLRMRVEWE